MVTDYKYKGKNSNFRASCSRKWKYSEATAIDLNTMMAVVMPLCMITSIV